MQRKGQTFPLPNGNNLLKLLDYSLKCTHPKWLFTPHCIGNLMYYFYNRVKKYFIVWWSHIKPEFYAYSNTIEQIKLNAVRSSKGQYLYIIFVTKTTLPAMIKKKIKNSCYEQFFIWTSWWVARNRLKVALHVFSMLQAPV